MKIINDFRVARTSLIKNSPFIFSFIEHMRFYLDPSVESTVIKDNTIHFSPQLMNVTLETLLYEMTHVALHVAFLDRERYRVLMKIGDDENLCRRAWNDACDYVNDNILAENHIGSVFRLPIDVPSEYNTKESVYQYLITEYSKSQPAPRKNNDLFGMLPPMGGGGSGDGDGDGDGDGSGNNQSEDKQDNDGNNSESNGSGDGNGNDQQDDKILLFEGSLAKTIDQAPIKYDALKSAATKSFVYAKGIGTIAANMLREINAVVEGHVNWRMLVKQHMSSYIGKFRRSSYSKRNRKVPILPGYTSYGYPDIYVAMDTSGSISEQELKDFLSETYGVAKQLNTHIHLFTFDGNSYYTGKIKRKADIAKLAKTLRGGGGTNIKPVLTEICKLKSHKDYVLIFSDGYIFDADDYQTIDMVNSLKGILLYTGDAPKNWCIPKIHMV
ncbi:putative metal-dependent peptidase [Methanococcus maripaludis]|uniref:Putative metal-dependent peptidase n=1 Tax=Methanococcus maripaludis TaxID=39152 RepID=A0A7J9NVH1_METMI|nr:VWA-like domain-containing protein [Methanococcus maripaludis]MBA2851670.1 putative metal-dependent peptidase [Methanococcus maripaludis]